jgi:hypothetical protein
MASLSSRRNSAVNIYVNGKTADGLYDLAKRIGERPSRYSKAMQRAQAGLARRFQPATKREIRKAYGVKQAALNKGMAVATGLRQKGDYVALKASVRRISLLEFGGAWGGHKTDGATASILLGTRKTYGSAFIATVGFKGRASANGRAIYVRQRGPDGKRYGRGPLRRLYGPSIFEMLSPGSHTGSPALRVRTAVLGELESFYVTELARQITLELRNG